MKKRRYCSLLERALTTASSLAFVLYPVAVHANPVDGIVSSGQASISQAGKTLNVYQQSNKAVIDWRGFDVAAGETTQFIQPSNSSVTLNRVNSNSASHIDGNVIANGNIVIINQNGVMFGAGAKVDVNGLVASTADIGNDAFMNSKGALAFNKAGNNPNASIVNDGTITAADAGLVGFVAPNVVNNGVITANLGKVQLASGDTATVDMYGDNLMSVAVSDQVTSQLVSNKGVITANGGKVALTAAAGQKIINSMISNTGTLQAQSVMQKNGEIIIAAAGSNAVSGNLVANKGKATGSSTVLNAGIIDASGYNAGDTGGTIELLGDHVSVLSGSLIDASGDQGGGSIKIGGDFHGAGTTPTALNTMVQSGSVIKADAITSGNGGQVTVWSDGFTQYSGSISARGGINAGDGGFVETSGKGTLTFHGTVDTQAPNGQDGMLLLDPTTITIKNGSGDGAADGTTTFNGSGTAGTVASGDSLATIYETELEGIAATTNISLQATNGITIQNLTTDHNLNLAQNAGHSVTFDAGAGAFSMWGSSADTITTANGALNIITGGGTSTIGNLTTGSGAITLNIAGTASAVGVISTSGGMTMSGAGTLTLYGNNTFTGGLTIKSGTVVGIINANALGAGVVTLGDSSGGSANATLYDNTNWLIFTNPIVLASNTTGTLTVGSNAASGYGFSGGISGANNLTLYSTNNGTIGAINNVGTVTNTGISGGIVSITGVIGSNVTGVIQNSATTQLALSGNNAFSGLTILSGTVSGTTSANSFGTGNITIGNSAGGSANATLSASNTFTYTNPIILASNTTGTLTIADNNGTFTGGVTGNNNLVINANYGAKFTTGSLNNAGTITSIGTGVGGTYINSVIGSNVTGVIQNSAGYTLWLTNASNAYTGPTTITAGTLKAGAANVLGGANSTDALVMGGGTLDMNGFTQAIGSLTGTGSITSNAAGTFTLNVGYDNTSPAVYSGTILQGSATSFSLNKVGTGTLTLSGTNTYTGGTTLTNGILNFANGSLGSSGNLTFAGGTLQYASGNTQDISSRLKSSTAGAITIDTVNNNVTFASAIDNSNTGGFTLNSTGTGILSLTSASNAYTGSTNINAGTLKFVSGALSSGNITFGGGTLQYASGNTQDVSARLKNSTAGAITIDTVNNNVTYASIIDNSNTAGLTLNSTGTGTLTLANANTFTGDLTVKSGTVKLNNNTAASSGTIYLGSNNANATISGGGASQTYSNAIFLNSCTSCTLTIASGGNVDSFTGGVTGTHDLVINNTGNGNFTVSGGSINNTGTVTFTGTSYSTAVTSVIGSNVTGVTVDESNTSLALWGSNTFTGGLTVKSGRLDLWNTTAASSGTITLGDGLNDSKDVKLVPQTSIANAIYLAPNTSGTMLISTAGIGNITLSGGVTGTGDLTINDGNYWLIFGTNAVNNSGKIINSGTQTGGVVFNAAIGSNVTGITQSSTTSALTVAGALNVNSSGTTLTNALGTALLTVSGGVTGTGNLIINNNSSTANGITFSTNNINNTGTVTNSGTGTGAETISMVIGSNVTGVTQSSSTSGLTLSGANTYTGPTTITGGTLSASNIVVAAGSSNLGNASSAVILENGGVLNYTGGSATYTRGFTIDSGVGEVDNTGAGNLTITTGGIVTTGGTLQFGGTGSFTVTSIISGTGAVVMNGSGSLSLNTNNTFRGGLYIKKGSVDGGGVNNAFGSDIGGNAGKGTVYLGYDDGLGNAASIGGNATYNNPIVLASQTMGATGTLSFSNTAYSPTYTGGVTGNNSFVIQANGAANTIKFTTNAINISGTIKNTGTGTGVVTISSQITGSTSVQENSPSGSVLILSGANDYTGATTVTAGTLKLGANNAISSSSDVTVASGATLNLNGYNDLVKTVTDNGTIAFSGASTLTTSGAQTYNGALTGNVRLVTTGGGITINAAEAMGANSFFAQTTGSGDITLGASGSITSSAAGNAIILASGHNFIDNNASASALSVTGGGNWLVYSTTPTSDNDGALVNNFKQYNATYGVTTVAGTGNGFLYSVAPTITASLTGTVSKTYDSTTTATLSSGNYSSTGALAGDTITLNNPASGTYDTATAGSGKTVSVNGISITSASNGSVAVYGYQLASSSASGAVGTINQAAITLSANNQQGLTYGTNTTALGTGYTISAGQLFGSDTISGVSMTTTDTKSTSGNYKAGTYDLTAAGATGTNGFNTTNYNITYATNTGGLVIAQKALTVSGITATNKTYDGSITATLDTSSQQLSGTVAGDSLVLGGAAAGAFGNANVGNGKTVTITGNALSSGNGNIDAANYSFTQQAPVTANITKAHLTVTADGGKTMTYGAGNVALTDTITGFVNGENATTANVTGTATLTTTATTSGSGSYNAGTWDIHAAANNLTAANYDFTYADAVGGLTVNKAVLTATANNQVRFYGDANPTFSETVSGFVNGDTSAIVTGSATGSSAATATSGVGTVAITGSVGTLGTTNGNYTYAAADGTLTINKAHLTVTADNQSMTYGAGNPTLTAQITGFKNGENSGVVSGSAALATNATTSGSGSYNAGTWNISAGLGGLTAANYDFTVFTPATLTVNKAVLTATANNQVRFYGDANPTFSETVSGFVNGDTSAIVTGSATGSSAATATSGVGTVAITGSVGTLGTTNGNYTYAAADGTLTINKAALTVTASNVSGTYGTVSLDGATGFTSTGLKNGENIGSVTLASSNATLSTSNNYNVGTWNITASAATGGSFNANNYAITYNNAPVGLTITPAALTITADGRAKAYGTGDPSFTYNSSGLVTGDTLSGSLTRDVGENVGNYNINQGTLTAGSNYTVTYNPAVLQITTASIIAIVADNQTKVYGDVLPTLTFSYSGLVNGDNNSIFTGALATNATQSSNVGNYSVTLGSLSAGNNYIINFTGSTLTITPKQLTVSATAASKTYGQADPGSLAYTYNGLTNGDTSANFTGTLSRAAGNNAGTYAIGQNTLTATGNYTIGTYNAANFTINQALLTVTANNQTRLYGDANPTFSESVTGFVNGDTNTVLTGSATGSSAATATSGVNTYTITGSVGTLGTTNNNYTFVAADGTLTINKAHLTVTADGGKTMTYGANSLPVLTDTITGYKNGEDAATANVTGSATLATSATAYNGTAGSGSNAGVYNITASANNLAAANYDFTYVNAVNGLTVNQAVLTTTANNQTRAYGDANPTFSESVTGFVNGDTSTVLTGTPTGSSSAVGTTGIGTYAITGSIAGLGTTNNNYTFAAANNGTLTINPAALTVTASNVSGAYGSVALNNVTGFTSTGLKNGETIGSVALTTNATLSGSNNYNAGNWNILASAATGGSFNINNYTVTYNNATTGLTVTPKSLAVVADNQAKSAGAVDPALTFTYSGLVSGEVSANFTGALGRSAGETANTYTITQNTLAATGNYAIGSYTPGSFVINGAIIDLSSLDVPETVIRVPVYHLQKNVPAPAEITSALTLMNAIIHANDDPVELFGSDATVAPVKTIDKPAQIPLHCIVGPHTNENAPIQNIEYKRSCV